MTKQVRGKNIGLCFHVVAELFGTFVRWSRDSQCHQENIVSVAF
jgi:hypothetical protein